MASAAPAAPASSPTPTGVLRITAQHGEVLHDKGGNGAETTAPLAPGAVLAVHDELTTNQGSIELASSAGVNLTLSGSSLVSLLGPNALYIARGELHIVAPKSGTTPEPSPPVFNIATPCGRSTFKARDARVRVDGNGTAVSIYDGSVQLAGGLNIASGQSGRCVKGAPSSPPRPLLAAPLWKGEGELILLGDGEGDAGKPPLSQALPRWQEVPPIQRYRVELSRSEEELEVPLSSTEVSATHAQVELQGLAIGSYVARVYAIDDNGALGQQSQPHRFHLARVGGLRPDGTVYAEAGSLPRISGPRGQTFSVLLDGVAPTPGALSAGPHKLRVLLGGLSAEVPLVLAGKPPEPQPEKQASDFQGDSLAVWIGSSTAETQETPVQAPASEPKAAPASSEPAAAPAAKVAERPGAVPTGPEDVLFGGIGEVPFDGVRSPWSRSYVGARIEGTASGSFRVAAGGRWAMKNGFGVEASVNVLRTAIANLPSGQDAVGFGNITAGLRSPAVRQRHFALQAVAYVVAPLSTSFLDRSVEQDPQFVNPNDGSTILKADVLPRGGGWRVEPAVLLSVRVRNVTLTTMQGVSLRISPELSAAYAGGFMSHTELVPALRLITFAAWQVNYLNVNVNPELQPPNAGGALGGGFEALIPTDSRGRLRIALLGRAGIGDSGEAIYGRAAFSLQLGYAFR